MSAPEMAVSLHTQPYLIPAVSGGSGSGYAPLVVPSTTPGTLLPPAPKYQQVPTALPTSPHHLPRQPATSASATSHAAQQAQTTAGPVAVAAAAAAGPSSGGPPQAAQQRAPGAVAAVVPVPGSDGAHTTSRRQEECARAAVHQALTPPAHQAPAPQAAHQSQHSKSHGGARHASTPVGASSSLPTRGMAGEPGGERQHSQASLQDLDPDVPEASASGADHGSSVRHAESGARARHADSGSSSRHADSSGSRHAEPGSSARHADSGSGARHVDSGSSARSGSGTRHAEPGSSSRHAESGSRHGDHGPGLRHAESGSSLRHGDHGMRHGDHGSMWHTDYSSSNLRHASSLGGELGGEPLAGPDAPGPWRVAATATATAPSGRKTSKLSAHQPPAAHPPAVVAVAHAATAPRAGKASSDAGQGPAHPPTGAPSAAHMHPEAVAPGSSHPEALAAVAVARGHAGSAEQHPRQQHPRANGRSQTPSASASALEQAPPLQTAGSNAAAAPLPPHSSPLQVLNVSDDHSSNITHSSLI